MNFESTRWIGSSSIYTLNHHHPPYFKTPAPVMASVSAAQSVQSKIALYTQQEMEVYVDALDAAIQAAVEDGTLIETTYAKKEEIVSALAGQE